VAVPVPLDVQVIVYAAVAPAVTDAGVCAPTVTELRVVLSVNLYCAVCWEVCPVAVIRNFTPPSVSAIEKLLSVNEPPESAVSVRKVSSESVSWICVETVSPGIHPAPKIVTGEPGG
jgi:hypothetical protein